jgi:hypothetical protein
VDISVIRVVYNTAGIKTIDSAIFGESAAPSLCWSTPPPLRVPPPPLFPSGCDDNGRRGSADAMSFDNQLRLEKGWYSKVAAPLVLLHNGLAVPVALLRDTALHPPRCHMCSGAPLCAGKEKDRWTVMNRCEIVYCFDGATLEST